MGFSHAPVLIDIEYCSISFNLYIGKSHDNIWPDSLTQAVLHEIQFRATLRATTYSLRLHWPERAMQTDKTWQRAFWAACKIIFHFQICIGLRIYKEFSVTEWIKIRLAITEFNCGINATLENAHASSQDLKLCPLNLEGNAILSSLPHFFLSFPDWKYNCAVESTGILRLR